MSYSKADHFEDRDILIARFAKAVSHPARIAILRLLKQHNNCYCGDLTNELPIAQSTVSQHLKELKNAGLIDGEITPPKVRYCINKENFQIACCCFGKLFE